MKDKNRPEKWETFSPRIATCETFERCSRSALPLKLYQGYEFIRFSTRDFANLLFGGFQNPSYSQEGEDMILNDIFEGKKLGFYVDVGAFHPFRYSNTYFFYKRGWKGINIDARPGSMKLFHLFRRRDINLEAAISNFCKELNYYVFDEPALNGFSEEVSQRRNENGMYHIVAKIPMRTVSLAEVLKKFCPPDQKIDFLSVDVEGLDYSVLVSNDWDRFRPKVVLVETHLQLFSGSREFNIDSLLTSTGYELQAKTRRTSIYGLQNRI